MKRAPAACRPSFAIAGAIAGALATGSLGCELAFPIDDHVSAGSPSPCTALHRFCADFDEGPLDASPRYAPFIKGGGAMMIDDAAARSLPASLLVTSGALAGGDPPAYAFLGPDVSQNAAGDMHLAFDLRIESRGSGDNPIATVGLHDPASDAFYLIQLGAGGNGRWSLGEYRSNAMPVDIGHASNVALPDGWVTVRLDVHFAAAGDISFASLTVAERLVFDRLAITPSVARGTPSMGLGITSLYGPTTPWALRFDNVTFDD